MIDRHPDSIQLARQWAIVRVLSESGRSFSVKELADQLKTTKSSVERDLATLRKTFALVEETAGKQKKRYRIAQKLQGLAEVQFGVLELLALHAAQGALHFTAGAPFYEDLHSVVTKIRGFLGDRHNGGLDAMARVFLAHRRRYVDYAPFAEVIDTLVDAIAKKRVCTATYHTAWREAPGNYVLRPLKLLFHEGALYLLARLNKESTIKILAVHRFKAVDATDDTFTAPKGDLDEVARKAFGVFIGEAEEDVEVVFEARIARMVEERVFHPDEEKERLPDGRLRFRLKTGARWEVVSWVLRYGDGAELVKPVAWRADVVAAAKALLEKHGGDDAAARAAGDGQPAKAAARRARRPAKR